MSVSTKKKRKLVCGEKNYYWSVYPDYDRGELKKNFDVLHIIAEDKTLELIVPLETMAKVPESVTPGLVKGIITEHLENTKK